MIWNDEEVYFLMLERSQVQKALTLDCVENFLISLGATIERHKDYIISNTICHNPLEEAESMKLYFYQNSQLFTCYSGCGGESFTIFELYKRYMSLNHYDIDDYEAEQYVKRFVAGNIIVAPKGRRSILEDYSKYENTSKIQICQPYDGTPMDYCEHPHLHPLWRAEGITEEVARTFDIGYSIYQNKIVIPHKDIYGNLIGIRGRAIDVEDVAEGKYRPIQFGDTLFAHHLGFNLYGIWENKEAIRKYQRAIIYEGEKSVLISNSLYGTDSIAVAVCGSNFNKAQVALLVEALGVNEIVIAFDKEYIGKGYSEKAKKYKNKIVGICKKYKHLCSFYYIWDDKNLLEEKDSPIDKGKDVFEKLFMERRKVI